MKTVKHLAILEMIALVFLICVYFEFSFLSSQAYTDAGTVDAARDRPLIKSTVSLNGQTLFVNEEITFTQPLKEAWLNIPSNLYANTKITKIFPECEQTEKINDNCAMRILFRDELSCMTIQYEINLENKQEKLSYQDQTILLTEFLIVPAPLINGKPVLSEKVSFGDPFVYQMHDYNISLLVNSDYNVFAPGKTAERRKGNQTLYSFNAERMRDFPIVLDKNKTVTKSKIRDIDIIYVGMPNVEDEVAKAFDYMEKKTGLYPYKEFFVINAPIHQQGMEFSQMIILSDKAIENKENLTKVLYHEIFHQWFYGLVGTDQINEPYLDEGLVNYLALALSDVETGTYYNDDLFNLSIDKYKTKNNYYNRVYVEGTGFYSSLQKGMGSQFDKLLKALFDKYCGKIMTNDDLVNEINLLNAQK